MYLQVKNVIGDKCKLISTKKDIESQKCNERQLDVKWTCPSCNKETSTKFASIKTRCKKVEILYCKSCAISFSKGGINFDQVREIAKKRGFLIHERERSKYKNDKSVLTVTCMKCKKQSNKSVANIKKTKCIHCVNQDQKLSYKIVRARFKKHGFILLSKTYKNKSTPLKYICKCGEISYRSLENLRNNTIGCMQCRIKYKRKSLAQVRGIFDRYHCKLNSKTYINRRSLLDFTCSCGLRDQKTLAQFLKGFACRKCCSGIGVLKRYTQLAESLEKSRQTCIEKYGVDHNMKTQECRDKAKETNKKNHGGVHNFTLTDVRKKAVDAHIKKYGDGPGKVKAIREKQEKTTFERYGHNYPLGSEIIKDRIKEKYGHHVFIHSDSGKDFMTQKYGAPYASQCPELFAKMMKTAFSLKPYKLPSGKIVNVQGYEPFGFDLLLEKHDEDEIVCSLDDKDMPVIKYVYDGKDRVYYTDFYVPKKNMLVEVKSTWTYEKDYEKNKAKFMAAVEQGYKMKVLVFGPKGEIIKNYYFKEKMK